MDYDHRGAEDIQLVDLPDTHIEAVPGAAGVGPVADTNYSFIANAQLLPANDELHRLVMEIKVALPQVEGVTHVRRRIPQRKPQRMQIQELRIERQPIRRNYRHASPNPGELIQTVLARDVPQRGLLLGAPTQFHVQRHPTGNITRVQGLDDTFLERIQRLLRPPGGGKRKSRNQDRNMRQHRPESRALCNLKRFTQNTPPLEPRGRASRAAAGPRF